CPRYYCIASIRVVFFFFQAEDGIRDRNVTGVQTCALPISDDSVELEDKVLPTVIKQPLKMRVWQSIILGTMCLKCPFCPEGTVIEGTVILVTLYNQHLIRPAARQMLRLQPAALQVVRLDRDMIFNHTVQKDERPAVRMALP